MARSSNPPRTLSAAAWTTGASRDIPTSHARLAFVSTGQRGMGGLWLQRPSLQSALPSTEWTILPHATSVAIVALAGVHLSRRRCRELRRPATVAASTTRAAAAGATAGLPLQILVPVASGSEEIETACITDTLTRAGAAVTVASVEEGRQVRMSRGLQVVADCGIADCLGRAWDAIVCPGGMPGAERLRDSQALTSLLKEQKASGRILAAVCASPAVVLAAHSLLDGKATCYPTPNFKALVGDSWTGAEAVVDGNIVTSQGPGTSLQFALKLVEVLYGRAKAEEVAAQMLTKVA